MTTTTLVKAAWKPFQDGCADGQGHYKGPQVSAGGRDGAPGSPEGTESTDSVFTQ